QSTESADKARRRMDSGTSILWGICRVGETASTVSLPNLAQDSAAPATASLEIDRNSCERKSSTRRTPRRLAAEDESTPRGRSSRIRSPKSLAAKTGIWGQD